TLPDDPAATVATCASGPQGEIGTLVLVPSSDNNAQVVIEVIAGVGHAACERRLGQTDCIVARRQLHFQPHTPLRIPIFLASRCAGVRCGPGETCDVNGGCVSAACSDVGCSNLPPPPPPPPGTDSGVPSRESGTPDAPVSDGGGGCEALSQGVDCDLGLCPPG